MDKAVHFIMAETLIYLRVSVLATTILLVPVDPSFPNKFHFKMVIHEAFFFIYLDTHTFSFPFQDIYIHLTAMKLIPYEVTRANSLRLHQLIISTHQRQIKSDFWTKKLV